VTIRACMVKLSGKELPVRNRDGLAADHDAIAFDSDADEPAIRTISDPIRRIP